MRRQAFIALLIMAAAILIAVIMVRSRPTVDPEPIVKRPPLVETQTLMATTDPLQIVTTGTVSARDRVNMAAQVSGRVVFVNPNFVEGGRVDQGETLIRLDRADFENRVQSAQADLAAQDVAVLQAEQDVEIARAELSQFDARFSTATATDGSPLESGFRPPASIENIANIANNAKNGTTHSPKTAARPSLASTAERALATREPQLQSARAARDRAKAGLSDAELALARTIISAPFSGLVASEAVAVGSIISAGQSLGEIVSSDIFEIRVSLSDQEAALIPGLFAKGESPVPARVQQSLGGQRVEWPAQVSRISAVRDAQTRRVDIFLSVSDPLTSGQIIGGNMDRAAPPLFIGSLVDIVLSGAPGQTYAMIKTDYLRNDNKIWLVEGEHLKIVEAELISRTDDYAAITFPDLRSRQTLVTSDLRSPVDGMTLRLNGAE